MGLSVQIGVLADLMENDPDGAEWLRESFDAANYVLRKNGLPPHHEPETLPPMNNRCLLSGYPYSWLHYLRRAYAHRVADPNWVASPLPKGEEPTDDPVLQAQYRRGDSHLLTHSDAEGLYLPIDFREVLFDHTDRIPGVLVGSSHRLLQELVYVAPAIGVRMKDESLCDEEAATIAREFETQTGLWVENTVWLSLYEAARLSVSHSTAIVFG